MDAQVETVESSPSKKGTALQIGITSIISIAAKDTLTTGHLICIGIIAGLVAFYIAGQIVLSLKKK